MTLTIVIVSYNARADLDRCLASLAESPPGTQHEIVVVDNASTDGAPEMVRARFPAVRLLQAPGNVGFAAANNLAIRASRADFVLLLNPDTIVPAGAVDDLVAALAADANAAALGPRIVDAGGVAELSFGRAPTPLAEARQKLIGRLHARGTWPARAWVDRATRRPREVDWVSGACLLVRRADALAAGLLDERYFLYWEDVDFCAALRARGRTVRFTPAATIIHLRGRSQVGVRGAAMAAYRRSQVAYYDKHQPRWSRLLRWFLARRGRLPADLKTGTGPGSGTDAP